ncbi:MAG: ComEC/Rec2 family competence protein [Nannocystaceae bacterium]
MRSLLTALGFSVGIGWGSFTPYDVTGWRVLALVLAGGCGCAGVVACVPEVRVRAGGADCGLASWRRGWRFSLAVVLLAASTGWLRAVASQPHDSWSRGSRDFGSGLIEFEVTGASKPGRLCVVTVRDPRGALFRLSVESMVCRVASGDVLAVRAADLRAQEWALHPGAAHETRYRHGDAVASLRAPRAWLRARGPGGYWAWVARQREQAGQRARGDEANALVAASVLGLRSALPRRLVTSFRRVGLGHLLAVSGLHIALLVGVLSRWGIGAGGLIGHPASVRFAVIVLPLMGYVGITGAQAPAVRAAIMFALLAASAMFGRPSHGRTVLAIAAAGMLAWQPQWATDPGFHLSMAAMLALVTAEAGGGVVALSWRITWFIAPLCWLHFGQLSAWAVLANLVAVPVFSLCLLPCAMLGWLLLPLLGEVALAPATWAAALIIDWVTVLDRLPRADPNWVAAVALAMLLLRLVAWRFVLESWKPYWPPWIVAGALLVAISWPPKLPVSPLADFYAVGGARTQAVLLREPRSSDHVSPACLLGAKLSPTAWSATLPGLGVGVIRQIKGPSTFAEPLRERLVYGGQYVYDDRPCPAVDPIRIRAVLDACRRRTRGLVWIRGAYDRPFHQCFARGRWQPQEILWPSRSPLSH